MLRTSRHPLLLLTLIAICSGTALAQDPMDAWKDFDFRKNTIKQAQLQKLEIWDLKLMRGLVFGRHGRIFKDSDIKAYLENQSWYQPKPDFNNSMLNETERRNLDLIRIAEAAKHETIQPGDMRYWRDRAIPARKLGKHSGAEWKVLQAEIEAIHGKRFDDDPWLQQILRRTILVSARRQVRLEEAHDDRAQEPRDAEQRGEEATPRRAASRAIWSSSKTGRSPSRCFRG